MVHQRHQLSVQARLYYATPRDTVKAKTCSMKMIVRIFAFCVLTTLALAHANDPTQVEKYGERMKTYQLDVPGKEPITIIESDRNHHDIHRNWEQISLNPDKETDNLDLKNSMTDIIHDTTINHPRCYGPSCQEGFDGNDGPQDGYEDYFMENSDKLKDMHDLSNEQLQAINALAAKLKTEKLKGKNYYNTDKNEDDEEKVFTSWNRLNVKQHKHPFDDKDGWVTLEPIAWSTSKISKWKPNVKKQKPYQWNTDEEMHTDEDLYSSYQGIGASSFKYPQKLPSFGETEKRPTNTAMTRPAYINNKLHISSDLDYDTKIPTKPTWNKPQQSIHNFPSSWLPDDGRRPHKPSCDNEDHHHNDEAALHGLSDSLVIDSRPNNFPYEYEALHQGIIKKRPIRRPTQVVYAGLPDYESDRSPKPSFNDGQWVLLSTTKGYRNKKRQRSLSPRSEDGPETATITSHQTVALTVLPMDGTRNNMTTSHGGMLEVEKSFKTVEESKQDMDKRNDLESSTTHIHPTGAKVMRRKIVSKVSPDRSTVLAAVGAGIVPATMAMVVPMMLGRRRRRRDLDGIPEELHLNNILKMQ